MNILETIPMYKEPIWASLMVVFGFTVALFTYIIMLKEGGFSRLIFLVLVVLPICIGIAGVIFCSECKIHTHDEYVVKLTDISVQEFAEEYTVVERYPYSDAIRVKKAVTEEK